METKVAKLPSGSGTGSLPQVSKTLSDVLADQVEGFYGDHGYDTRATTWVLPATITEPDREEARKALGALAAFTGKATRAIVLPWLFRLGATVASQMTADEARVKAEMMASMLIEDYPAGVFTPETLRAAARAFKWFPAYAELCERLDMEKRKLDRLERRLRAVAAEQARADAKPTPQKRAESIVRSAVRKVGDEQTNDAKPVREPILTHPPTSEQIEEWSKAVG